MRMRLRRSVFVRYQTSSACWPAMYDLQTIAVSRHEPVGFIDAVSAAVEETVPELAADIVDLGIMLAGSGALRRNLDRVLRHTSRLPVSIAENPLECVVLCAMRSLVVKAQRLS